MFLRIENSNTTSVSASRKRRECTSHRLAGSSAYNVTGPATNERIGGPFYAAGSYTETSGKEEMDSQNTESNDPHSEDTEEKSKRRLRCRRCLGVRKYERKYCGEPNYHGAEPENHEDELPQQSFHSVKGNELRIAFDEINYQRSDLPGDKVKNVSQRRHCFFVAGDFGWPNLVIHRVDSLDFVAGAFCGAYHARGTLH